MNAVIVKSQILLINNAEIFDCENKNISTHKKFHRLEKIHLHVELQTIKSNIFQIGERLKTGETPGTAMGRARPSTAVRAVGFSSESMMFDPFNQAAKKTVVLESKKEDT